MADRETMIKVLTEVLPYSHGCPEYIARAKAEMIADQLIANGVTIQRWIPVTERLPTKEDANPNESVLAIRKDDGFARSWVWDIVARYTKAFTHWMPLPQMPKEE